MKIAIQYVTDMDGNIQAIQLPLKEWEKVLAKLRKQEQILKLKSDLKEAFEQVKLHKEGKIKLKTAQELLNEYSTTNTV